MRIRTNTSALRAFRESKKTRNALSKNLEKLSSGLRINRAADDAAGLGISEKMRAKITELGRCQDNVLEGQDLARTADGALAEINDMLCRARGLCIEAANGTYSDQELTSISNELNSLFREIDRITAGSCHNTIRLFRGDVEPDYRDIYDENFQTLPTGQVEPWGEMEFVQSEDFDRAEPAQPATATFPLDDSIDFGDVTTLEGKSIRIGNNTYYFTANASSVPSSSMYTISLSGKSTEQALQALSTAATVHAVEVDKAARTVKLTAECTDLVYSLTADGKTSNYTAKKGNGEAYNGLQVQNPSGTQTPLLQVDGFGILNNQPTYSKTATASFQLSLLGNTITADQANDLKRNSLSVSGWMNNNTHISDRLSLSGAAVSAGMTRQQVGAAVAAALNNQSGSHGLKYSASYNATTGMLEVTAQQTSPTGPMGVRISELTTSPTPTVENKKLWESTALGLSHSKTSGTMESGEKHEITIPASPAVPFSFQIGSNYYLYHDGSKPFTEGDFNTTWYSPQTPTLININTIGDVQGDIARRVQSYVNGLSNVDPSTVTTSGGKVTFSSNVGTSVSPSVSGTKITVNARKTTPGSGTASNHVLMNTSVPLNQTATASFDLGGDVAALAGRGFSINSQRFEFTNGAGVNSQYQDIDISSCTDLHDVAQLIQAHLASPPYTVTLNGSKMEISVTRNSEYKLPVSDGQEGILAAGADPVVFSGGVNVGHSQKVLDFSSIHEDNLDTLLGKGFRINCATCEGEYINVFFCWTNDGSVPPVFDRWDSVNHANRTIHNIPVELSKVTSGDKIVESIVEQVRPTLTHYTDVAIGDPPTTLIAMDKRLGDVTDPNTGRWYPGRVQTGLETNFTYSVSISKERVFPPDGSVALKSDRVKIYAGSDPAPQFIDVHLPYIDLEWLRLNPPELVDLAAADQDPSDWLTRVDQANLAISDARGTIGADFNRLEHAWQDLNQADIQLTDAESGIRDADVAELMMEHTKLQILTQSQQSMMAQANVQAQQILQLLR